jgi:predicted O-linked N-acetylglucosamine transferase (SPINDLY family)
MNKIPMQVPNSILWLLRFPYHGEQHIVRFCMQRGINTKRIVFSNVAAKGLAFY